MQKTAYEMRISDLSSDVCSSDLTGMSYSLEVDCVKAARSLDLLTTPYVFNTHEARLMAEAGADIIVAHMGLTTKGKIGAKTARRLDECVQEIGEIARV